MIPIVRLPRPDDHREFKQFPVIQSTAVIPPTTEHSSFLRSFDRSPLFWRLYNSAGFL